MISCGGAVHAEYFLQSDDKPLVVTQAPKDLDSRSIAALYSFEGCLATKQPQNGGQVHFKTATMLGALAVAVCEGAVSGKILAQRHLTALRRGFHVDRGWDGSVFTHLPSGVQAGEARVPFFGGWDSNTWLLAWCLILNNFLVADQMRRLTSVAKWLALALTWEL